MYKRAIAGEISDFTGVDDPYEEPEDPELVLDTERETVEESARKVVSKLEELGYMSPMSRACAQLPNNLQG
jgi:adenylylsulfate kinase-like enzyme